ncbi:MAG: type II toxin-antitoxin system YafQ family toxin [Desulfovibrio sp.]|jgi:mRNA interferase YafQ|nr:type II toxin-antitoxin system YafQ family toxin [Desulfovibrio sp.]
MRTIKRASNFKKDFRRIAANPRYAGDVGPLLENVIAVLVDGEPLPESCRDHALVGDWKGHRECHIKPDLLLIYRTEEPGKLRLVRLGSHSELYSR